MRKESRRDGYEMHETNQSNKQKEVACSSLANIESVLTALVLGT